VRVAVFSAFPQELRHIIKNLGVTRILRKHPFTLFLTRYSSREIVVVQTGIGTHNAEAALNYVIKEHPPDLIVSAGFGGALYDGAEIGELVWASRVLLVDGDVTDTLDFREGREIFSALSRKITMREGSILTLARWMKKTEIKSILPEALSFPVCDMETFPLARTSLHKGLRFFAVRSITDRANEEIPPELLGVSDESGRYKLSRALALLLKKPHLIPSSVKLGRGSAIASKNLWRSVRAMIELL
jgi:nucleoside phosphorylase